jgi:serine protease Do
MSKAKKIIRLSTLICLIAVLSSLLTVFLSVYAMPLLNSNSFFSKWKIFNKNKESVTVINKTEQVMITEQMSLEKITAPAVRSVVNIISVPKNGAEIGAVKSYVIPKNGTGVILTGDGIIAASRFSINESAEKYFVQLFDGSQAPAELLSVDSFTDLVFLKIKISNLPSIPLSKNVSCQAGEKLIVIKNDGTDYGNSYIERSIKQFDSGYNLAGKTVSQAEKLEGVCRIFPVNKDAFFGIAINYQGELVGITSGSEINGESNCYYIDSENIFSSMKLATDNLLGQRPFLGLYYRSLNQSFASANNLARDKGALIYSPSGKQGLAILAGSPAEKAKLRIGDIITAVDGIEINVQNPLSNLISKFKKGDEIKIIILRDGKEMEVILILE